MSSNMYEEKTIKSLISDISDATPIPGGGAVAALNGALSASLIIMVSGITIKGLEKKKITSPEEEKQNNENILLLKQTIQEAEELKNNLLAGMGKDVDAYEMVVNAYKLPKNTEEEKNQRNNAIQEALKVATIVPLENAEMSLKLIKLSELLFKTGKKSAASDVTVSRLNADAGVKGAFANVEINLNDIKDENFKKDIYFRCKEIVEYIS